MKPDIKFIESRIEESPVPIFPEIWKKDIGVKVTSTRIALDKIIALYDHPDGPPSCFAYLMYDKGVLHDPEMALTPSQKAYVFENIRYRMYSAFIVLYGQKEFNRLHANNLVVSFGLINMSKFINVLHCARRLPAKFCCDMSIGK